MIHRKLGTKRPTYCTLYISRVQSYNFFAIFAIVNIHFFNENKLFYIVGRLIPLILRYKSRA